jgi:hypothetical protein
MYDFGWLWQDITDGPSTCLQFGIWHSVIFDSVASNPTIGKQRKGMWDQTIDSTVVLKGKSIQRDV